MTVRRSARWKNGSLGGRLVLAVGAEARSVLDPSRRWHVWPPESLSTSIRSNVAMRWRGSSTPSNAFRLPGAATIRDCCRTPRQAHGVVLVEEGDLPLVVRTPRGFGEITFVAFDLDRRPLADWKLRGDLARRVVAPMPKLAHESQARPIRSPSASRIWPASFAALDQFSGVRMVPFWVVGTLIFGYILLVGPIDYLLVRRVFKRMELTWITFPAIVLVVSVGACAAAVGPRGASCASTRSI